MFQTKSVEKIKTHILCSIIVCEHRAVYDITWKDIVRRGAGHGSKHGARALHAGYLRLPTHIRNM